MVKRSRRNPVAKFASLFNKARIFKDRTKYDRRTKLWLKEQQAEANAILGSEKSKPCETKQSTSSKKLHKEDQRVPGLTTNIKGDNRKLIKATEKLSIEDKVSEDMRIYEWKL